ncbi:MAG: cyclic dehypoxanthinyl futalosine synthase [Methanosarcinales archaeon]
MNISDPLKSYNDALDLAETILSRDELTAEDALSIYKELDLHALGRSADLLRRSTCGDLVTFVVDRNINYTNICKARCRFCAFYRDHNSEEAYVLTREELLRKVAEAVELGATQILLQGGLNPDLPFEFYEEMLATLTNEFPGVHLHAFSPPEIVQIASVNGSSIRETLSRLQDAGLDSIPGGGAEILDDRVRRVISPRKIDWKTWRKVMITAHSLNIPTTATMVFGHAETLEERICHIFRVRDIQEETGGFTAFIPWTFQEKNTALEGRFKPAGGVEYLRTIAISRLILNNHIPNIQASWVTQGHKVAQIALTFGANDLGGTMLEENVVRAAGVAFQRMTLDQIRHLTEKLGRPSAKRDTLYNILEEY